MSSQWEGLKITEPERRTKCPITLAPIEANELVLQIPCTDGTSILISLDGTQQLYNSMLDLPEDPHPPSFHILEGHIVYKYGEPREECNICGERGQSTNYILFHQNEIETEQTWIHADCSENFLKLLEEEFTTHSSELASQLI